MNIDEAARRVKEFENGSLTRALSELENSFSGLDGEKASELCDARNLDTSLLEASFVMKSLAGKINIVIHAAGILSALPKILDENEVVESLSLGAGNTGRFFDLETNERVAEFKFIHWKGGPESIRQNPLFKDFFELAESKSEKRKYLYVLGKQAPLKFFNGGRSLKSVLSKNSATAERFYEIYGNRYSVVREYFEDVRNRVEIVDISPFVEGL